MAKRFRLLSDYLAASEPDSPAYEIHEAIRAERNRLVRAGLPPAERLQRLEAWLAAEGLLDRASAFAAQRSRA